MNKGILIIGIIAVIVLSIFVFSITHAQEPFSIYAQPYGQNYHLNVVMNTNNHSTFYYGLFLTASNITPQGNIIWLTIINLTSGSGKITEIHASYSGKLGQNYIMYFFYNQSSGSYNYENNSIVYTFNTTNNEIRYEILAMPYNEQTGGTIFFNNVSLYMIGNYLVNQEYLGFYPGWSGYYDFFNVFNQMLTENMTDYTVVSNGSFFNTGNGNLVISNYNVYVNSTYSVLFLDSSQSYSISIYQVEPLYYISSNIGGTTTNIQFSPSLNLVKNLTINSNTLINLPSGQYAVKVFNGNNITWINFTLNHNIIINLNQFFYGNTNEIYFVLWTAILLIASIVFYYYSESLYPSVFIFDLGYFILYLVKMPYFSISWFMAINLGIIIVILGKASGLFSKSEPPKVEVKQ